MILNTGYRFTLGGTEEKTPFEKLYDIFQELITHTSGDVDEAIDWLRELDKEYELTDESYTIDNFVEDLLDKGYLKEEIDPEISSPGAEPSEEQKRALKMTAKLERELRKRALEQLFGNLKKKGTGAHKTSILGQGDHYSGDLRSYSFGDSIEHIDMAASVNNAMRNHGLDLSQLQEDDLVVKQTEHKSQMSTVLMIDISHSMILYGEDRITPAKKVAMALAEMITTRYPKDTLDILVFGNDAWPIKIAELPYLNVGPYHTNTVAGLDLAMKMLARKKHSNKQIFMITDGKPSCLHLADGSYYKNSAGLDPDIVAQCYNRARIAQKNNIQITTFMIAQDPYLMQFVREFTEANRGKAFYTGLDHLGEMIFEDYNANRKRKIR
jgi:uncharacterized protein with von Willebrand factor type A (vWA) domain